MIKVLSANSKIIVLVLDSLGLAYKHFLNVHNCETYFVFPPTRIFVSEPVRKVISVYLLFHLHAADLSSIPSTAYNFLNTFESNPYCRVRNK